MIAQGRRQPGGAAPNLNWMQADEIPLSAATPATGSATSYFLDRTQERWYRFPVGPGGTVHVEFTGPHGSVVSLHRDPTPFYNELIAPTKTAEVSAGSKDAAFLPSQSLPSQSLPSQSLERGFLPSAGAEVEARFERQPSDSFGAEQHRRIEQRLRAEGSLWTVRRGTRGFERRIRGEV